MRPKSWLERGSQNAPVLDANCFIHSLPFDPLRCCKKKTLAESVHSTLVSGTHIVRIFNKARVKKMINNEMVCSWRQTEDQISETVEPFMPTCQLPLDLTVYFRVSFSFRSFLMYLYQWASRSQWTVLFQTVFLSHLPPDSVLVLSGYVSEQVV